MKYMARLRMRTEETMLANCPAWCLAHGPHREWPRCGVCTAECLSGGGGGRAPLTGGLVRLLWAAPCLFSLYCPPFVSNNWLCKKNFFLPFLIQALILRNRIEKAILLTCLNSSGAWHPLSLSGVFTQAVPLIFSSRVCVFSVFTIKVLV